MTSMFVLVAISKHKHPQYTHQCIKNHKPFMTLHNPPKPFTFSHTPKNPGGKGVKYRPLPLRVGVWGIRVGVQPFVPFPDPCSTLDGVVCCRPSPSPPPPPIRSHCHLPCQHPHHCLSQRAQWWTGS